MGFGIFAEIKLWNELKRKTIIKHKEYILLLKDWKKQRTWKWQENLLCKDLSYNPESLIPILILKKLKPQSLTFFSLNSLIYTEICTSFLND